MNKHGDNSKAAILTTQALRLCPLPGDFSVLDGLGQSKFATTLEGLLRQAGGVEEPQPHNRRPGNGFFRKVFQLPDGSICAIRDGGAKTAINDRSVIRLADGSFVDIWNEGSDSVDGLSFVFGQMPESQEDIDTRFEDLRLPGERYAAGHPLNTIGRVVGIDGEDNPILVTDQGFSLVPSDGKTARQIINDTIEAARSMAADLNIPLDEILSELAPKLKLLEEVEKAFEASESFEEDDLSFG